MLDLTVDFYSLVAFTKEIVEELIVLTLATNHHWWKNSDAAFGYFDAQYFLCCFCVFYFPLFNGFQHNAKDFILWKLLNWNINIKAVGLTNASIENTQVVINLRNGSYCWAWVAWSGFLVNRNSRRQAWNLINIRLLHLIKKLSSVWWEWFNIATLPFGKNSIKRKWRLSRSRGAGNRNQCTSGHFNGNVL